MINSWSYQLQNIDPVEVGKIKADVKVVDYSRDGTRAGRFNPSDVATMRDTANWPEFRQGASSVPRVLSYISIGEAETYRDYWDPRWLKDKRPLFLGPENPDWPGNYKVEFWHGEWKAIIFRYLDDIINAEFDGVYLDIIDAYEFWEERGTHNAGTRMIRFVAEIADYCRARNPSFWIVPQNGDGLLVDRDYRSSIDAQAKEDWLYGVDGDDTPNSTSSIAEVAKNLDALRADGKPVLVVEYVKKPPHIAATFSKCKAAGYVPLIASRELGGAD